MDGHTAWMWRHEKWWILSSTVNIASNRRFDSVCPIFQLANLPTELLRGSYSPLVLFLEMFRPSYKTLDLP